MKTTTTIITALLWMNTLTHGAPPAVSVTIVDDVSGKELKREHGIEPAKLEDVKALADIMFIMRKHGKITYDVIDEDGANNVPLVFHITPFASKIPKVPTLRGMTVSEKRKAIKSFKAASESYIKMHEKWKLKVLDGAERWVDTAVEKRLDIEAEFLRLLQLRQRDFKRSDIIGCIHKVAVQCKDGGRSFLVLNSDLIHQPGPSSATAKMKAIQPGILPGNTTIIVVNTSHKPDKSPILKGLPNKIIHANNLINAAEVIRRELGLKQ